MTDKNNTESRSEEKSCESCGNPRKNECLNHALIDSGFCRNAVGGWQRGQPKSQTEPQEKSYEQHCSDCTFQYNCPEPEAHMKDCKRFNSYSKSLIEKGKQLGREEMKKEIVGVIKGLSESYEVEDGEEVGSPQIDKDALLLAIKDNKVEYCHWGYDSEGCHETTCGHIFQLNDGTLKDNKMKYCCYCGNEIKEYDTEEDIKAIANKQ